MNGFEVVGSWLTPTVLFCILNLMIATIFILNPHRKQQKLADGQYPPQLDRVPSLFGRVRSINLSMYRSEPQPGPDHQETYQPQLVRVPSLLERVRSINLPMYRSEPQPDPVHQDTHPSGHKEPVHEHDEEERSHVTRSRSETVRKEMKAVKKVLGKSVSEKSPVEAEEVVDRRRPATVREKTTSSHGDEAVDAKADDFIKRFRQQLTLQRLDSILRYKEMLGRGTTTGK